MTEVPGRRPDGGRAVGYLEVLLAGTLWALSGPISVTLFRLGLPPTSVALLRPLLGVVFLGVFLLAIDRRLFQLPWRTLVTMLLVGGVVVAIFQVAYQMSTDAVGVPSTVALLYLAPAIVVAVSPLLLGERLTAAKASLATLSVVGVWLTVVGSEGVGVDLTLGGLVWGVLCGAGYASVALYGRWFSPRYGALAPLFYSTLGGTVFLLVSYPLLGWRLELPVGTQQWGLMVLLALTTMALAPLALYHAMRKIEAGRAAIGTTIEPFVATLLAILLVDQGLRPVGWLGLVLLVVGVAGAYAMRAPTPPSGRRTEARPLREAPPG